MSIRSYKDIYTRFAQMFPELNRMTDTWKGVLFRARHILIFMKDGSTIHFRFWTPDHWELSRVPERGDPA